MFIRYLLNTVMFVTMSGVITANILQYWAHDDQFLLPNMWNSIFHQRMVKSSEMFLQRIYFLSHLDEKC